MISLVSTMTHFGFPFCRISQREVAKPREDVSLSPASEVWAVTLVFRIGRDS